MTKARTTLFLALTVWFAGSTLGQQTRPKNDDDSTDLLKKFDTNRDGKIDDTERQAVRERLRQMRTKPGAMTPSGKTETIGNRAVTEMEYASSDGRKIPCVLSMPTGNGPFPVLVTIHGGQGNRDLGYIRTMAAPNQLSPTVAAFNEQPWAILAISYRAGNGALFGMEQDDVVAGIRFAKTLPKIDSDRVGVIGGSHGGHLALVAAEKMGHEFLCVAAGSPWMTDPVVYMTGDPNQPPLSLVPAQARDDLVKNGRHLFQGLTLGRGMSERQAREFITQHSIEANADKIVVPSLFITSRGDDQAPHVLIEPMLHRMKAAGKDVTVYTAEKSPHGFYWARTVSAARALRGEKSPQEAEEEWTARRTIIDFFTKQFARKDAKTDRSPKSRANEPNSKHSSTDQLASDPPPAGPDVAETAEMPAQESNPKQEEEPAGNRARPGRGLGGADFQTRAGDAGKITREAFKKQVGGSAAIASRPELADRLFDRLNADGDGSLNTTEYEGVHELKSQFGRGGQPGPSGPSSRGANRPGRGAGNMRPSGQPAPRGAGTPTYQPLGGGGSNPVAGKTSPLRIAAGDLVGEQAGDVRVFRGVPYAAPPIGAQRWQAADSPQAWTGIRQATQFGAPALQGETFRMFRGRAMHSQISIPVSRLRGRLHCRFAAIEQESGERREESRREFARPFSSLLRSPLYFLLSFPRKTPRCLVTSARLAA
jgi:acetyl esterase/lipase